MTSKPKESINCIYYVNMIIATDPINPNNIIQFTNYNNTHALTLLIGSADSVFNKQTILMVAPACSLQNRIQQFQRIPQSNPNSIRHSNTLVSYYILLWCYLHSLARCCFVMLAVAASHGLLRSSYTKAFSRSAESLSKTFKSFPSATDS